MKKSNLLIANSEIYNMCYAIEYNIQIWWDNSDKKLSNGE